MMKASMINEIRYYRGRHKIKILEKAGRKALVEHLERGFVGPKNIIKYVFPSDEDIVLIRHCWRKKGD